MEKPILFSTPMVQAILAGRKTQTRRAIKPQPYNDIDRLIGPETYVTAQIDRNGDLQEGPEIFGVYDDWGDYGVKCPWQPSDTLWVRETFLKNAPGGLTKYFYKADEQPEEVIGQIKAFGYRWKPSIHMPRAAARLFLKVKDIRVERLQDITEEDAKAEGVIQFNATSPHDYKLSFIELWDSIYRNRGYGWKVNPFVWVISFEVAK